ncbi:MAG: zinc ABC transporter solute-binding protein [Candidatus Aminicenantes bacterium]|nr:zinc ABC transporter solute-binding protein [Candidatus Aminicenantes bacterium]NIM77964.1 zinc ABC transporter solute-binding protein [Candidatus Aminicenantes bacterium]NIN17293.1 zinc ABC transporter solute-binding protein [Candidatus Aminicenantes bacterium]NIN41184.1 zinc ABC transporter solute-binding protein [Candidatus Aminicenantes bacterium]NIN83961.1 zinc ABC transporter solute-binding protein [Candidatus Aminicenantes bacterium]
MRKIIICVLLVFGFTLLGYGKIKVVTSYRYIADITQRIGGDLVSVTALAKGNRNPHFITPKPSFIAKLRKAHLLIINGGQLEIGWLPPVMQQANNPKINTGSSGFLSLMELVKPIDVHLDVSRAHGDVHPEGNPHIQLDPYNIPIFARAVKDKLCRLDPDNCRVYMDNYDVFNNKWKKKIEEWEKLLIRVKDIKVVEYHKLYDYLFHRYHIESLGTLEPLPGIPPTSRHVADIIELIKKHNIRLIFQDVYHSAKTARFVANKTGAKVVIIPHDVGAVKEAADIFSLFDEIARRLTD